MRLRLPLTLCLVTSLAASAFAQQGYSRVSVRKNPEGTHYEIASNGVPDHLPGRFPNRHCKYFAKPTPHAFLVPLDPAPAEQATPVYGHFFGVAVNGVPYDPTPTDVLWRNRRRDGTRTPPDYEPPIEVTDANLWQFESLGGTLDAGLDRHNAHVTPLGLYHYHGPPEGHRAARGAADYRMTQLGFAADGYPIYDRFAHDDPFDKNSYVRELASSYRVKSGPRPGYPDGPGGTYDGTFTQDYEFVAGSGDLDEFNGREGITPEYPDGTYYYVITDEFPFLPRSFRGTPDESFRHPWYARLLAMEEIEAERGDPELKKRLNELRAVLGKDAAINIVIPKKGSEGR